MKLNQKAWDALTLPEGKHDHIEWDNEAKGFGYRMRRAGEAVNRTWIAQYKFAGRTRRMSLGNAAVVGADEARDKARKALGKVANGQDPQAHKQDRRDKHTLTLRSLAPDYLAAKKPHLKERSLTEARRYLTKGYFKPLHYVALDSITRRDVAACVLAISRKSGGPTAALARGALSGFFVWAMSMGMCDSNPTIGSVKPPANKARDRVLSESELARIWRACDDSEHGRIVKLLILTGCRRQEIGGMDWREFNPDGTWTLPEERSKNKRKHTLPMMPMMREIIEAVPRIVGRNQLFGTTRSGYTAWSIGKKLLDERAGVEAWTTHDIRRTAATRMADLGIMPHIVETILNHVSGHKAGPAGVYNHSLYANDVRAALEKWHAHISKHAHASDGVAKFSPMTQVAS